MTQSGRSAHWEARLTGDVIRMPTADLINQVVDEIVAYKASRPAYWALLHGSATGDRPAEGAERLHRGLSRRVAEVLAVRAPPPRREPAPADRHHDAGRHQGGAPAGRGGTPGTRGRTDRRAQVPAHGLPVDRHGAGPLPRRLAELHEESTEVVKQVASLSGGRGR
ncbi:hypothetical protein OG884_29260 [Streptosporangium sp. NBC_01755]|nr:MULTISPECIES: hypothetical protein [unclassified Streptosporangium]WSA22941.1 hypothetical protein OIE13_18330 [Streptosporangium sp. NBC_01810]WSC98916.1 hypothetical protein OG884_29260 [Streptosporangium sp. NBC_01755]